MKVENENLVINLNFICIILKNCIKLTFTMS